MGLDVAVEAGYKGLAVTASADASMSLKKNEQNKQSDESEGAKFFSVGGKYSPDRDTWMAAVGEEPMPIEIPKIKPITWIFTPRIFKASGSGDATRSEILEGKASAEQLEQWEDAIAASLKTYCQRVKKTGKKIDCTNPAEDEIKLDIAALMAKAGEGDPFGGIFTTVDRNARTSDFGCPPKYLKHNLGKASVMPTMETLATVSFCWRETADAEYYRKLTKNKPILGGLYALSQGIMPTEDKGKNPVTDDTTCPSGYSPQEVVKFAIVSQGDQKQYHGYTTVMGCYLDGAEVDVEKNQFGGMFASVNTNMPAFDGSSEQLQQKTSRRSKYFKPGATDLRLCPNPLLVGLGEKHQFSCPKGFAGYSFTEKVLSTRGVVCWNKEVTSSATRVIQP
jgi:hypothetical protein